MKKIKKSNEKRFTIEPNFETMRPVVAYLKSMKNLFMNLSFISLFYV